MSTFVLCVGCGIPLCGFSPCQWCTCEWCGNDLQDGFCLLCNLRNSCIYDPNPSSFDCHPDSCHPPHPTYETYSYDSYGNDSYFGYDCQPQFPLNYESEPGYIENYNSYPYDSLSFPQQYPCCEDYGKQEEKRIEEEQAANAQYWKIPACCDDDDDYNSAITPNEPVDSLGMGDEHLETIPATGSDEFIKSCVENLVPNPRESEEEIIPMKIDQHHFNVESDLIGSMLNHDSSIIPSSSKIDSLLDEFAGELTLLKSIPPGIYETDCYPEDEIRFTERLLYDNSSPRPPKEFVSENSNANIESFFPSLIPVEDSDSSMEEIDLSFNPDDPMPLSIEEDDDDSGRDIIIHKELLDNYSLSLPENESFRFDIPSFYRPPAKPPNGNTRILNITMMGDISEQKYSWKFEDSYQRILSFKSSFPQLQLGIILLHLAGSQPMLKSSYKAEDGVIISIPPLVRDVVDVVVEIKGTDFKGFGCRRSKRDCQDALEDMVYNGGSRGNHGIYLWGRHENMTGGLWNRCQGDEDSMLESVMSEDATREALRMAKDTLVLLEMVISKPRKRFPHGKESVHGKSPFLSTKNADFPQTIGTKGFEKRGNMEDAENGRVYGDYRS
uniref:Pre-mRNA splicing Prp18-interacting factor n=1 Tax=Tanacetum cinerariifolium TaxID=118510 RepID=A0A6L2MTP1_TANCI|nr:pre-mRNA splicing Prp18-interacting factor [Tanacetum cinerariifolium]